MNLRHTPLLLVSLLLTACATAPTPPPIDTSSRPEPVPVAPPQPDTPPPAIPPVPVQATTPTRPTVQEVPPRAMVERMLPAKIADRKGWTEDIYNAFTYLKLPFTADNLCAVGAVIEQESSWQSDPSVPNLPAIVWEKIGERAHKYLVPLPVVKAALLKTSPNGQSYKSRIDNLRTEREMNLLFEDMAAEASKLGLPMNMKNPIRTGGPMQVSVEFAEAHVKVWPYPYRTGQSIRNDVFTRQGGVYFGSAILLQYPAPYSNMLYRFADFNAGRYSSRNAAFQQALTRLGGGKLALDGDLMDYTGGKADSSTYRAARKLATQLNMRDADILRDLKQEKAASFGQSELYRKAFALADQRFGQQPRERLPQIDLVSPKITRKLTTEWFAKRVEGRYQACLQRMRAS